jgi:Zn-dependent peptidase ImmA (M78 family)
MSTWGEVRQLAWRRHQELAGPGDALVPAAQLIDAAAATTRLTLIPVPLGDVLLNGAEAAYDHERREIYYAEETAPPVARFHIAHEFGHHWLDEAGAACAACDLDVTAPSEPDDALGGEVGAYSPKERAEALANVYARELLVPREKLRRRCLGGDFVADTIATELGVPVDLVMHQLADALLLPEAAPEPPRRPEADPDDSQREAIECGPGPRLVRAGPGSGKTRTLVGRVAHLISRGEEPSSIPPSPTPTSRRRISRRESARRSANGRRRCGPARSTHMGSSCCEGTEPRSGTLGRRNCSTAPTA